MKILGIIAEYNPFHNGHIRHLKRAKELTNSEYTIVIMSGNFVQRGEPAFIDKWLRAKSAIDNGVDLIIELPFVYSIQTAEIFSLGAIKILHSLNICDFLAFGCENDDLVSLNFIADNLIEESTEYKSNLKSNLKKGYNFAKARELSLYKNIGTLSNILSKPNNILAIEYIKALKSINSNIKPIPIKRTNDHNSSELGEYVSSSTSIRESLKKSYNNRMVNILHDNIAFKSLPFSSKKTLIEFINENRKFLNNDDFFYIFLSHFFTYGVKKDIFNMDDDLLNRIENILMLNKDKNYNLEDIFKNIKTKNYVQTRINRALINYVFDIKKDFILNIKEEIPNYIRILASNKKGFELINMIKRNSNIRILNNFSKLNDISSLDKIFIDLEIRSTNIYYQMISRYSEKLLFNLEYTKTPYIKKE